MKIKISTLTDVGLVRDNNEDALISCPDLQQQNWTTTPLSDYIPLGEFGSLLVVADGMGGPNAGEVASALTIETVKQQFSVFRVQEALKVADEGVRQLLTDCVIAADAAINQRMATDSETDGMGTTIVLCWILPDGKTFFAWCGDSRGYIYNTKTGLRRITKDHSLVQEMIDRGEITEEEAFSHPDSNIITCGLGGFQTCPMPEIVSCMLQPKDMVMLCSDGLCGYCTDNDIQQLFSKAYTDVSDCSKKMLQSALKAGGEDNIAIAMASLVNDDQEKPDVAKHSWLQRLFGSRKC